MTNTPAWLPLYEQPTPVCPHCLDQNVEAYCEHWDGTDSDTFTMTCPSCAEKFRVLPICKFTTEVIDKDDEDA